MLDMQRAAVITSFDYEAKATVVTALRALRQLPYTAMLEVTVIAKRPITLSVRSAISASFSAPWDTTGDTQPPLHEFTTFGREVQVGSAPVRTLILSAASATVSNHRVTLAAAQSFLFDAAPRTGPAVKREDTGLAFTRRVGAGSRFRFVLVGTTISSAHVADPTNEAQRLVATACVQGIAALIAQHERAWADLWKSDILIEGDEPTQRDVHSMLYHLYSFIRDDSGWSISPMGLSGSRDS